ncbi:GRF zinc finger domain-containing [Lecanosticta acicola]|uniref:GRF zinc finger domain-containing n=1 Tax=Lecanosticta acicola TaxID=111012 RepID=A0AAI9E8U5_9PEZI|nr:GRF zinc finger domain-containing [Lecanosticta acicola]
MEQARQHKLKKLWPSEEAKQLVQTADTEEETEDTEFKLAALASLHPNRSQEEHLEYLLAYGGSIVKASAALGAGFEEVVQRKRPASTIGYQSSIDTFATCRDGGRPEKRAKLLTKKGQTLHLYSPKDVEQNTPCSIVHNFLPADEADALLKELLKESKTYERGTFQLFEKTVQSPHTWKFYVDTAEAVKEQQTEYVYDGLYEAAVSQTTPELLKVQKRVRDAVNTEVQRRIRDFHPNGQKLRFQSPEDSWEPNASFVNCYDGGKENVGYHSDQLTYLGPRAIIGSLSLGVAREFRVRRIVPQVEATSADEQGQIAIHLPHNSLLVMHAEMQEEWKHSIAPAQTIDPHPVAGNKRLNVTYRCYKDYLHPKYTPRCKCDVSCVLRCVQKRKATRGRYMWMCYANYTPGRKGCSHFEWAEFDEDGRPPWVAGYRGNANVPVAEHEHDVIRETEGE